MRSVHVHMSVYCLSTTQHRAFSAVSVCRTGEGVGIGLAPGQQTLFGHSDTRGPGASVRDGRSGGNQTDCLRLQGRLRDPVTVARAARK